MAKIDYKQQLRQLYRPSAEEVSVVDVPELRYLMIDGRGDPNSALEYREAVEALYAVAYALKFAVRRGEAGIDYAVMPLEGLWWADDMRRFSVERKGDWLWTMMIMQPEPVTDALFAMAQDEVQKKKALPALPRVRLEAFREGRAVQIMHIGPYAAEAPTVERLHRAIDDGGFELAGKHHEIYLSDPRKSAPETMRTIVRQPFAERRKQP